MSHVIYHPKLSLNLIQYGIEIPIKDDRSQKVYESLKDRYSLSEVEISDLDKLTFDDLLLVHDREFIERLFSEKVEEEIIHAFELRDESGHWYRYNPKEGKPLKDLFIETLLQASGTLYSAKKSLKEKFSFFLGGGMHHAMSSEGRGFCLINDIVLAIRKLQENGFIQKALVIDLDAHKGDGTAEITQNDSSIMTFSIHMKDAWPMNTGFSKSLIPSSIDIAISSEQQRDYLKLLKENLLKIDFNEIDFVMVVDGSDPYEKDELESTQNLNLDLSELLERDLFVFHLLLEKKIPQCWLMAGGYGKESHQVYSQFLVKALDFMGKNSF